MKNEEEIFNNDSYKFISNLVEEKISILRNNKNFNEKYIRLTNEIENLEKHLNQEQREQFNEIIKLFYETEEYYFALSYSLGIKYGKDLEKI